MIILTKEQADSIRGKYGKFSEIDPIMLKDELTFFVSELVLKDDEFIDIWDFLNKLPRREIDENEFIKNEEII